MAQDAPNTAVSRLPIYLRTLTHMNARGQQITSSKELASILGSSAAQIRKDLSHFGEFGKQGTGYHVPYLMSQLQRILNTDRSWGVGLVGVGKLGHALLHNQAMTRCGFRVVAAFDINREIIGNRVGEVIIQDCRHMKEEILTNGITLAIIAVPPPAAQQVADELVEAGIKAILNYSPIAISVPPDVMVQYLDPVAHLQRMTYYL